jgi:Zn-dependent M28 family amino/carboxypeptidase
MSRSFFSRHSRRAGLFTLSLATLVLVGFGCAGDFTPCGDGEVPAIKPVDAELRRHVYALAGDIGERNLYLPDAMARAAAYIEVEFRAMGYTVRRQEVPVKELDIYGLKGPKVAYNIEVVKPGTGPDASTLVIGAHYDTRVGMPSWDAHGPAQPSRVGTPGANDNGSGVAALLYLARTLRDTPTKHEIRFVAYANEEPPFYRTDAMGSRVHARALVKEIPKEKIIGMISLETLGCYSSRVNRKRAAAVAPGAVGLPDSCDYVAFLSTFTGKAFSASCAGEFSKKCRFQVRPVAFPYITNVVSWSDDWSYMKEGLPSFAVTDTAFLRCDDYHESGDTAEKLDYPQFAEVTLGLRDMFRELAQTPGASTVTN